MLYSFVQYNLFLIVGLFQAMQFMMNVGRVI